MKQNWEEKYDEFSSITDSYGITEEVESVSPTEDKTIIALTINGSIVIISVPDRKGSRSIRYQSIRVRNDESRDVPATFSDKIRDTIEKNKKIIFEKTIETSPVIRIKTAGNITLADFEQKATELTAEFTKVFSVINDKTIAVK
jgi:ribosomal protein S17E